MSVSGVLKKEEGGKSMLSKKRWTPKWITITEDKFQYFASGEETDAANDSTAMRHSMIACTVSANAMLPSGWILRSSHHEPTLPSSNTR